MPNVALNFLPAVLQELARIDVLDCIEVVGGSNPIALQMLRHGEIDGVLGRLASPSDMVGLHFLHLYVDAVSPVVRRGHPLLRVRLRAIADLLPYTVLMPPAQTIARDEVEHLLHAGGLDRLPRRAAPYRIDVGRAAASSGADDRCRLVRPARVGGARPGSRPAPVAVSCARCAAQSGWHHDAPGHHAQRCDALVHYCGPECGFGSGPFVG